MESETIIQANRLLYLLRFLLDEAPQYRGGGIPAEAAEQRLLFRSLCNTRPPSPISDAFLKVQDAYLQQEARAKGIVEANMLPALPGNPQLAVWRGDCTTLRADAIVNAANSALLGCFVPCHGCIDNAIHTYAGIQLRLACHALMEAQGQEEPVGTAKITPAYNLPCRAIIHTVGPIINGTPTQNDCDLLAACYRSCLDIAFLHRLSSIAFCCISTGEFRFPQTQAAEIAIATVKEALKTQSTQIKVVFNVYKDSDETIYRRLLARD